MVQTATDITTGGRLCFHRFYLPTCFISSSRYIRHILRDLMGYSHGGLWFQMHAWLVETVTSCVWITASRNHNTEATRFSSISCSLWMYSFVYWLDDAPVDASRYFSPYPPHWSPSQPQTSDTPQKNIHSTTAPAPALDQHQTCYSRVAFRLAIIWTCGMEWPHLRDSSTQHRKPPLRTLPRSIRLNPAIIFYTNIDPLTVGVHFTGHY